jgi:hypothetical protein
MFTTRVRLSTVMLALAFSSAFGLSAQAERWPGDKASIGGAIAARIVAIKCNRPALPSTLTQAEIAELDAYIDERQTSFMLESKANQRFGVQVFPTLAREYDRLYKSPDACDAASRDMVKDMLARVRADKVDKRAELKQ